MYLYFIDILCFLFPFLSFSLQTFVSTASTTSKILSSFDAHGKITNILYSDSDKMLVVGAVNRLFVLNANTNHGLVPVSDVVTGPVDDSPHCNSELTFCVDSRNSIVPTDNWNKILVPAPTNIVNKTVGNGSSSSTLSSLLICGSVRLGTCEIRSFPDLRRLPVVESIQHIPVAANAPNASTVAASDNDMLFVAASHSSDSLYRDPFPAVSTRLFSKGLLPIGSGNLDGEAAVFVRVGFRDIRYVSVFTDERFIYWASVQSKATKGTPIGSGGNHLISKLIRICRDDTKYTSYSELEIQCRSTEDNTHYNVIQAMVKNGEDLIGAFSDSNGENSAICIFNMAKIRLTFWYNIDRCRGGIDSIGLPHIGRDTKCTNRSHASLSYDTCQMGVGGTIEASQVAAICFKNRTIVSLDVKTVDEKNLIVLGTSDHRLIQFEMAGEQNSHSLRQYFDGQISDDAIDLVHFLDDRRIAITSNSKLMVLRISVCDQELSCSACLRHSDPLCGWCIRDGRCSRQTDCMSQLLRTCPVASTYLEPRNISATACSSSNSSVLVPITGLLDPAKEQLFYECFFGTVQTRAKWTPSGIRCRLPNPSEMHVRHDSTTVSVEVKTGYSRSPIVGRELTFYNCSVYSTCASCVYSKWNCKWCPSKRLCFDSINLNCRDPFFLNGQCPRIDRAKLSELLVPDSANISIVVPMLNLHHSNDLMCRFHNASEHVIKVPGSFNSGRLHCSAFYFHFEHLAPQKAFVLELMDGDYVIDKTTINVYKCDQMASDCSQCFSLDQKLKCAWCDKGCHFRESDSCKRLGDLPSTTDVEELCDRPLIESIFPLSGPIEGGTLVEIRGKELGTRIQDIRDRIRIAGSNCKVTEFEVSKRIVCVTERVGDNQQRTGPVRITIGRSGRRVVESNMQFEFKEFHPRDINPTFGPVSGGTKIVLRGSNLNIGRNVSVYLDNLPCVVQEDDNRGEEITCVTTASFRPYKVTALRVQIDSAIRILDSPFEYRTDPTFGSINPKMAFECGGRKISIAGNHFDSAHSVRMFLLTKTGTDEYDLVSNLSPCKILTATKMECDSPRLQVSSALLRQSTFSLWSVGFEMDGFQLRSDHLQFTTVPNPQFSTFVGVRQQPIDQPLMIEGRFLSQGAEIEDYNVTVGTKPCLVFILDANRLFCRLSEQFSDEAAGDLDVAMKDGYALVAVTVGQMIHQEIGPINFIGKTNALNFFGRNLQRLGFFLAPIFAFLILGVFFTFWLWHKRNNKRERVYRRIQLQMEQMERNVRNECKQAFAELQTDIIGDLRSAIDDGIPFFDRGNFILRILFPLSDTSFTPSRNDCFMVESERLEFYSCQQHAIQFDSLLWNKNFIFSLVQLVEENSGISISKKCAISSFLVGSLSRNMIYLSNIILDLLSVHIQKSIMTKTSHLLFRQSDSLIEKLFQQWFSICLYPHLTDAKPGQTFFLLYKAIKYQTEKGPVDFVTGEAKFALSEQRLLRETVDATSITLLIIPMDGFDQAPIVCKALQSDTVSQLKSKFLDILCKNQPYSLRLQPDQFDFEWNCPLRGSIILLDDSRPQVKGSKKLNTIAYYNLPNNALLAMHPRASRNTTSHTLTSRNGGGSSDNSSVWSYSQLIVEKDQIYAQHQEIEYYHLNPPPLMKIFDKRNSSKKISPEDVPNQRVTNIPEVFLTRLLMCKGTIQRFMEDFFDSVFLVSGAGGGIPIPIKYLMDYLDQEAFNNNIKDPELIHAWKTNALFLRFWMQLINNPHLLFDIQHQPNLITGSLVVVGQTLIDACGTSDLLLNKESPSSKLLFAKEIAKYRPLVIEMFQKIAATPPILRKQFNEYIELISTPASEERVNPALFTRELMSWIRENGLQVINFPEMPVDHNFEETIRQIICSPIFESEHLYDAIN